MMYSIGRAAAVLYLAGAAAGLGAPGARAASEAVVYAFAGGKIGTIPSPGLVELNGVFYGTTCCGGADKRGTVFSVTPAGVQTVLHSFLGGRKDGANPLARLIAVNGVLYGTTGFGGAAGSCGAHGCGTVFSITPQGVEAVVHKFTGADGAYLNTALLAVNGTLYGTTEFGGASGDGTVFSMSTAGDTTVLYTFPFASDLFYHSDLVNIGNTLYGATSQGGGTGCDSNDGCGTVYAVTTSGTFTQLHAFGGAGDGQYPLGGLTVAGGNLYGTTTGGGSGSCGSSGCGVVYEVTPSGTESILYAFPSGGMVENPSGDLTLSGSTLYGVGGGGVMTGDCSMDGGYGCGAVYSVTLQGAEQVVYAGFMGGHDASEPGGPLLDVNGVLYGTSGLGGSESKTCEKNLRPGCGTVFSITP